MPSGDRAGGRVDRVRTWAAVALAAVVLTVIAVGSRGLPQRAFDGGSLPFAVSGRVVGTIVLWLLAMLAPLVVAFVVWSIRSGERLPPRPRLSVWRFLGLVAVVTIVLSVIRIELPGQEATPVDPVETAAVEEPTREWWGLLILAGVIAASGLVIVMVLAAGSPRTESAHPSRSHRDLRPGEVPVEPLGPLVDSTDPRRRAVIDSYRAMLEELAGHGLARRLAEAPEEYVDRLAVHDREMAEAAGRLTRVFARAAFGLRPLEAGAPDEAGRALDGLRRRLDRTAA